ncbi:uncharacterized protein [Diabrotica undecimpunctata]|uniref:uncharacterized protein n=1 Tax=Diabrotica undecimpunctata TaxID=50387 RepID=UPI003B642AA4
MKRTTIANENISTKTSTEKPWEEKNPQASLEIMKESPRSSVKRSIKETLSPPSKILNAICTDSREALLTLNRLTSCTSILRWVKVHSRNKGNHIADRLTRKACEREDETVEHVLCDCPELSLIREYAFGESWPTPAHIREMSPGDLSTFLEMAGWTMS